MKILSIETSCDETAIAIVELKEGAANAPEFTVLGNALHSQVATHAEYGGVFPMLAKREHTKNILPLLHAALEASEKNGLGSEHRTTLNGEQKKEILTLLSRENDLGNELITFLNTHGTPEIDAIAVTSGPGLEPALWVGITTAKALALAWNKPLIPINHMEGHIVSVLLAKENKTNDQSVVGEISTVSFPALALLISGGHTELVGIDDWHSYKILGSTLDDAVGEAFDKVARILGLPYPGGPQISKLADEDRAARPVIDKLLDKGRAIVLPRPMITSPNLDFSFSGLKTAVLYMVRDMKDPEKNGGQMIADIDHVTKTQIAREFEDAATDVLVTKTRKALEDTSARTLILGGGVVANTHIRKTFETLAGELDIRLLVPSIDLSTDNAVMIGIAGLLRMNNKNSHTTNTQETVEIKAQGNLSLDV